MHYRHSQHGMIMYQVLIFGAIALLFVGGLTAWAGSNLRFSRNAYYREVALNIAESGIEYYRWHLAHNPTDYQDGTGQPGPYIHEYRDAQNRRIGQFTLTITPPLPGSTIVTITSKGQADAAPLVSRTIEAVLAKPSLAKYAVAANADIRFGAGTEVFGQIHSNGGIRFDGVIHNLISSSQSQYNDPDHSGNDEFGVHTHVAPTDPLPPASVPRRTDVFQLGRSFPVPPIDFNGLTADLANIKSTAQNGGYYLSHSGSLGYRIVLKTNDTMDIYRVTALNNAPWGCSNSQNQDGWGTWSVRTQTLVQSNRPFPSNGAIFVEDHLWIEGQINTARLTIASGRFPENPATDTSITTNNDLRYTNYDGQDVISLIAQNNINVGLASEDDLRVDAALIAKNGRIGRYYYSSSCGSNYRRTTITSFGMLATNKRYGWAYTDGTGYTNRNIIYDGNLLYSPPPYFPITAEGYERLSWKEVR